MTTNTNITRADLKGTAIRFFDGRTKVGSLETTAKAAIVEGVLAALTFPTTVEEATPVILKAIEEALLRRGSVIPNNYREGYGCDQNCGDDVAVVLKDYCGGGLKDPLNFDLLRNVAEANKITDRFDVWVEKKLNPGMVRMNVGNVLRGMVRREEPVVIGDKRWNVETPAD